MTTYLTIATSAPFEAHCFLENGDDVFAYSTTEQEHRRNIEHIEEMYQDDITDFRVTPFWHDS